MTNSCIVIVSDGVSPASALDTAIALRFGREGFECLLLAPDLVWLQSTCAVLRGQVISCLPMKADTASTADVRALLEGMALSNYISVLASSAAPAAGLGAATALTPKMRERGNGTLLFCNHSQDVVRRRGEQADGLDAAFRKTVRDLQTALLPSGINVGLVAPELETVNDADQLAAHAERCWQLHVQKPSAV